MFETLGVLIIFLILLGFAMIFYNLVQQSSLEDELAKQAERKSLEISEKALLLPELDCSVQGITELNCMDMLKLQSFAHIINSSITAQAEYFNTFETSSIRVRQLWPPTNISIVIYDRPPERWRSATVFASPILLHYPGQDTNTYGLLEVITYG